MPITADLGGKNYTLGKGRAFFDRYPNNVTITATTQGEGERYLGNTTAFSTNSTAENLDHYDSDAGVKTKDDSVQLSLNRTGKFETDNVSSENVALFFLGDASILAQTAQVGLTSDITNAKHERFYQLGASAANPSGVRSVANVVVKKETTPGSGTYDSTITAAGNYEVDEELGRIYILSGSAAITDGVTDVRVTFDTTAVSRKQVISSSNSIYGALRFVSGNPKGENRDYYFPYTKLAPDGDYSLKGEEWLKMGFNFEILKKGTLEAAYIDGRPGVV